MYDIGLKLLPTISGIATAILAAWLSARWAVRRIYAEKLWAKREKAYTEIINALYDLLEYSELNIRYYSSGYENPRLIELKERYDNAHWKLKRASDIGDFFISKEAAEALKDLRNRPRLKWEENPPSEIYEEDKRYYTEALKRVRDCAIIDLRSNKA